MSSDRPSCASGVAEALDALAELRRERPRFPRWVVTYELRGVQGREIISALTKQTAEKRGSSENHVDLTGIGPSGGCKPTVDRQVP